MRVVSAMVLLSAVGLSGCSTLLDRDCDAGKESGVSCAPMEEIYRQVSDGSLHSMHNPRGDQRHIAPDDATDTPAGKGAQVVSIQPGDALYIPPQEWRIWFDRWVDHDGDLHDESYVFVRVGDGHWKF